MSDLPTMEVIKAVADRRRRWKGGAMNYAYQTERDADCELLADAYIALHSLRESPGLTAEQRNDALAEAGRELEIDELGKVEPAGASKSIAALLTAHDSLALRLAERDAELAQLRERLVCEYCDCPVNEPEAEPVQFGCCRKCLEKLQAQLSEANRHANREEWSSPTPPTEPQAETPEPIIANCTGGTYEQLAEKNPHVVIERLQASPAPAGPKVSGWQPIETAPKDGTPVLLFCNRVRTGYYSSRYERWFECVDSQTINPTHWQPLPQPPRSE